MPTRKSGAKELRKNKARQLHNLDIKTSVKKSIKSFMAALEQKDKTEAKNKLNQVYKKLDKAAKVKLLKPNTVSRRKSRLSKLLNELA